MRNDQDKNATRIADLKRVDEIIKRATGLWIGLLGALVFASVTLAGVKDIAFFNPKVGTQLPFTGVAVPVVYFFYGGSLLIAVVYIYLHIYLEQLWDILGKAPALVDGRTLSERLHPWLVADFALRWRDRLRKTPKDQRAAQRRALSSIADFAAVVLVWLFTPAVLVWFWWRSMPAHDPWMTGLIGACLLATIYVGVGAYASARVSLNRAEEIPRNPRRPARWVFGVVLPIVTVLTVLRAGVDPPQRVVLGEDLKASDSDQRETRTFVKEPQSWDGYILSIYCTATKQDKLHNKYKILEGDKNVMSETELKESRVCDEYTSEKPERNVRLFYIRKHMNKVLPEFLLPARADLENERISEKPSDWVSFDYAKSQYKKKWCEINFPTEEKCLELIFKNENLKNAPNYISLFYKDWKEMRNAYISSFSKVNLRSVDLRRANLRGATLDGVDLRSARLDGANIRDARLEYANMQGASLLGVDLRNSHLDGADLRHSHIEGSDIRYSSLNSIIATKTYFDGALLIEAQLANANLQGAYFRGADLRRAVLDKSNLSQATLTSVVLEAASIEGAKLTDVVLEGSYLANASIKDSNLARSNLRSVTLRSARLENVNLDDVLLQEADLEKVKIYASSLQDIVFGNNNMQFALITGNKESIMYLEYYKDENINIKFGALRYTIADDLDGNTNNSLNYAFGDGTVVLSSKTLRPCQWAENVLSDEEFFGRWKGWLRANHIHSIDYQYAVDDLSHIIEIPPPSYCVLPEYRRDRPPPPSLPSPSP